MLEMKVPSPGESISEVEIAEWLVETGDWVEKDQAIAEVDSDKATLELPAEEAGIITLKAEEGDAVAVGAVVCLIDTDAPRPAGLDKPKAEEKKEEVAAAPNPNPVAEKSAPAAPAKETYAKDVPSVSAKKMMDENGISKVTGTGKDGRVMKQDVVNAMAGGFSTEAASGWGGTRDTERVKMSMLRRKVAERLVAVKNDTAMLTTFNEIDMKPIMDIRAKYKVKFKETLGTSLGFMSFFTKAVTEALNLYPAVNGMIDGKEMIMHNYADIGIAVSSPKGLMVPVVRNAERMSLAEIESEINLSK